MKIISVDNFNREMYSDKLVVGTVDKRIGEHTVRLLNITLPGSTAPEYFKLVEDDHELYIFKP